MSGSGVSRYAHDDAELHVALDEATVPGAERDRDDRGGPRAVRRRPDRRRPRARVAHDADAARRAVRDLEAPAPDHDLAVVSLAGVYLLLTIGAQGVAALGVGVAKPPKTANGTVFLGVRVTGDELRNAQRRAPDRADGRSPSSSTAAPRCTAVTASRPSGDASGSTSATAVGARVASCAGTAPRTTAASPAQTDRADRRA